MLSTAFEDGLLRDNIAKKLVRAKAHCAKRSFLTKEELVKLSQTPCKSDVLRRAGLFSCLTGLRLSDCIRLRWENIIKLADGGWAMDIITKKTSTAAILPISDEVLQLCGDRSEGIVFNGLTPGLIASHLKEWISASGITKHITFHCLSHSKFFYLLNISELSILKNVTANDLETSYILFLSQLCNIQRTL